MNASVEAIEAEIMQLASVERSHLLERLIARLDCDPDVETAWEQEADRRESELDLGLVAPVDGHKAIARLRAKLRS